MNLDPNSVYDFFVEQGINHVYHANTVATSCTFIKHGGLLSRGAVEDKGFYQTSQSSDKIDKQYNVWHDIFLDNCDLHERFPRQNYYGPVLFKFNVDILKYEFLPQLWVTKNNPIHWNPNHTKEEKYYQTFEEFEKSYFAGTYKQMITLKNTNEVLPFHPYLEEIVLDNPRVVVKSKGKKKNLKKEAIKQLSDAILNSDYNYDFVEKSIRQCTNCFCKDNYLNQHSVKELKKLFFA